MDQSALSPHQATDQSISTSKQASDLEKHLLSEFFRLFLQRMSLRGTMIKNAKEASFISFYEEKGCNN